MLTKFSYSTKLSRLSEVKIAKFHTHFCLLFESLDSFVFTNK